MTKILAVIFILIYSLNTYSQTVSVFLLRSANNELSIEKIALAENETKVFVKGDGSENISIILPVSVGISGDFSKAGDKSVMIARYKEGKLIISVQKPDGTQKELLSKSTNELKNYDIKVNVTGYNIKKVFNISKYDIISEDNNSPVNDMFQGKIPIGEGDYSITTEITEKEDSMNLEGEFDLEYSGGYYFTRLKLNDRIVDAIIDLGAAQSFLIKSAVPEGVSIYKAFATEVSAEGNRAVELPVMGFGGEIKGLNACEIDNTELGNIKIGKFTFNVMDSLQMTTGKKIEAIIGLDIISKTNNFTMFIPNGNNITKAIIGKGTSSDNYSKISIPFTISQGHIFVKGKVGNSDFDLILDTGSPFNFLPLPIAEKEIISIEKSISVNGADGNKIVTYKGKADQFSLNNFQIGNTEFRFTDSKLLEKFGSGGNVGLLGTSFFEKFKQLQIDFKNKGISLE